MDDHPDPTRRPVRLLAVGVALVLALSGQAACPAASSSAAAVSPALWLSFDDGPDPVWTARVLDVLAWKHERAIFCVTGEHAAMYPGLVRRIAAEGHLLCDHSWDHAHLLTLDSAHQIGEVARTYDLLVSLVGAAKVRYWRAPYGQSRTGLDGYAHYRGMTTLGWNAQGSDWSAGATPAGIEALEDADIAAVPARQYYSPPGDAYQPPAVVVLLHDARGENHTAGTVERWASAQVAASLTDRYPVGAPG